MNICIVGTGYVGLVAAACLAEMGNDVTCIDINPDVIDLLNSGKIHIFEPGLESLVSRNAGEGRLKFSTDLAEGMADALFVFSCVGTPSRPDGSCDLSYVDEVAARIGQTIEDYKIIINKSTVPVGTADRVKEIIESQLKERGKRVEFDVVSNPEFLKEGDAVNDFMKPDRVIVGTDNVRTAKLLETLYAPFARSRDKMIVMGVRSAEMTKYAANCMLATKISFMNEVANMCETVGADVREVRAGIGSDRRIGYHFIYPGVGYGGSCFPKDVRALIDTAKAYGCMSSLVEAVDSVNNRQKGILADKVLRFFEDRGGVAGKTLALWGAGLQSQHGRHSRVGGHGCDSVVDRCRHDGQSLRPGGRRQCSQKVGRQRPGGRIGQPVRPRRGCRCPGGDYRLESVPQPGFFSHQKNPQNTGDF